MFTNGQKVIILKLYNLEYDGIGTYLYPSRDNTNKGKHVVVTECGDMAIELERLIDANEYWERKRKERHE